MTEEEKQYDENKKRVLIAIAILLGAKIGNDISEYENIPEDILKQAEQIYSDKQLLSAVPYKNRISERDVQILTANIALSERKQLFRIVGHTSPTQCLDCAEWDGTIVSMYPDGKHKTVQDFINNNGFHINCKCSLQAI